jgi:hypothetical protein
MINIFARRHVNQYTDKKKTRLDAGQKNSTFSISSKQSIKLENEPKPSPFRIASTELSLTAFKLAQTYLLLVEAYIETISLCTSWRVG